MTIDKDDVQKALSRGQKSPAVAKTEGLRRVGADKSKRVTGRELRRMIERAERRGIDTLGRDEIFQDKLAGGRKYGETRYNDRKGKK